MKPTSLEELYRAKDERRRRLAALPIEEKVRIMEKLQEMGRLMRASRASYRDSHDASGRQSEKPPEQPA